MITQTKPMAGEQAQPPKQILQEVRETVQGAERANPELKTLFYPFPLSRKVVVDFKTWVFVVGRQPRGNFEGSIADFLASLGYNPQTTEATYSPGLLIGIGRPVLKISLRRAEAAIYYKYFGDLLYTSLRVAYKPFFSFLRLGVFVIVCALLGWVWGEGMETTTVRGVFAVDSLIPCLVMGQAWCGFCWVCWAICLSWVSLFP